MMVKKKDKTHPWMPPSYTLADISALQALERGEATPDQQQRALKWIINDLCRTYDMSYRPDSDRDTVFAEGRRFPGLMIVEKLRLHVGTLRRKEDDFKPEP